MDKLQMIVLLLKFFKIVGPHLMEAYERIKGAWSEFKEGQDADKAKAISKELTNLVDKLKPHIEDSPETKKLLVDAKLISESYGEQVV